TDLRVTYWELAPGIDLARDITGAVSMKPATDYAYVGKSIARRDLHAKLTGVAFVQDMELPGMVHGRVCRPPSYGAKLKAFDTSRISALPGVVDVLVSGNFIGLCAEREEQALNALALVRKTAQWEERAEMPASADIRELLSSLPSERKPVYR